MATSERVTIDDRAEKAEMPTAEFLRKLGIEGILPKDLPQPLEGSQAQQNKEAVRQAVEKSRTIKVEVQPGTAQPPPIPTRKDHLDWLVARITELHRDKERRWPGVKARRQADREWSHYKKTGAQPAPIEPRDEFKK